MNISDLEDEMESILPAGFHIETDSHGQIIVYTGLEEDEDGELVGFISDEEEDLDSDLDHIEDDDIDEWCNIITYIFVCYNCGYQMKSKFKTRNPFTISSKKRKGGPMRSKKDKRKSGKNKQKEWQDENC